jgi:hypothetical protein
MGMADASQPLRRYWAPALAFALLAAMVGAIAFSVFRPGPPTAAFTGLRSPITIVDAGSISDGGSFYAELRDADGARLIVLDKQDWWHEKGSRDYERRHLQICDDLAKNGRPHVLLSQEELAAVVGTLRTAVANNPDHAYREGVEMFSQRIEAYCTPLFARPTTAPP